jgi:hypothetical protein
MGERGCFARVDARRSFRAVARPYDDDGHGSLTRDSFGDAAEEHARKPAPRMRAHRNQARAMQPHRRDDGARGRSLDDDGLARNAAFFAFLGVRRDGRFRGKTALSQHRLWSVSVERSLIGKVLRLDNRADVSVAFGAPARSAAK